MFIKYNHSLLLGNHTSCSALFFAGTNWLQASSQDWSSLYSTDWHLTLRLKSSIINFVKFMTKGNGNSCIITIDCNRGTFLFPFQLRNFVLKLKLKSKGDWLDLVVGWIRYKSYAHIWLKLLRHSQVKELPCGTTKKCLRKRILNEFLHTHTHTSRHPIMNLF